MAQGDVIEQYDVYRPNGDYCTRLEVEASAVKSLHPDWAWVSAWTWSYVRDYLLLHGYRVDEVS